MSLFSVIMCCFQTWFPDIPGGKWRENRSKHLPQLSRSLPEILTACFSRININKIRKNENYLTVDILVIVISNANRGKTVHWGRDGNVNYEEWTRGEYQIPSVTTFCFALPCQLSRHSKSYQAFHEKHFRVRILCFLKWKCHVKT